MKTKFLFLLLLFQLHHCFGQEVEKEVPYFVMAYVYDDDDFDNMIGDFIEDTKKNAFKSLLFTVRKDSFVLIDTLNTKGGQLNFMSNISLQKYLYYVEQYDNDHNCLTIFDYSKKLIKRRFKPNWDTSFTSLFNPPWAFMKNDSVIIYNEWKSKRDPYVGYGRNINFKRIKFEIQDLEDLYLEGNVGFEHEEFYQYNYFYNKTTKQFNYWEDIQGNDLKSKIQIPNSLNPNISSELNILINNSKYQLCYFYSNEPNFNDTIGQGRIYNKNNGEWQKIDLIGVNPCVKNWEDWIYGTGRTIKCIQWCDQEIAEKLKPRYDFTFGNMPNVAIYPGILYLYHIPTKKTIKWYPGDRDSEIITIHEGTIYYRVFDEIRTVELDTLKNEINWPSQKLLIRDKKRVPNIHWMFFAPKQDKVEEVWVNRPKGIKE